MGGGLIMTTKSDVAAWVAGYNRDFNQLCVALVFQAVSHFGTPPSGSYPDANAARQAARIDGTDMNNAPGGAIGYYSGGTHGDICISMGDGTWLHASAHLTPAEMLRPGDHVGFLTDAQYRIRSGYTPRGWSHNFGAHPSFTVDNPPVNPAIRHTVPAGVNVRPQPTTSSPKLMPLKGNIDVLALGYAHGQTVLGSDLWYQVTTGWAHCSGFTAATSAGIEDHTPATPPVTEPPAAPPVATPTTPKASKSKTPQPTKAELEAAIATIKAAGVNVSAGLPGGVLAGLFSGNVAARRRAYFTYSIWALILSIGPDLAITGWLTGHSLIVLSAAITLATSATLKVGTAFGFIAASNTK